MTADELKEKIQTIARQVYGVRKGRSDYGEMGSDEYADFPELKSILIKLLTKDFRIFIGPIDWVAPKPTTFRINLKNGQEFYLIYTVKSWVAQIEGKKYYLLNINELQNATNAIARMLRYGNPEPETTETEDTSSTTSSSSSSTSSSGGSSGGGGIASGNEFDTGEETAVASGTTPGEEEIEVTATDTETEEA